MNDLIRREAAIEAFEKFIHEIGIEDAPYNYGEIALCEANVPSAEKVGKWILADWQVQEEIDNGNYCYHCSNCGKADIHAKSAEVPYCWWCGARMRGEEDE